VLTSACVHSGDQPPLLRSPRRAYLVRRAFNGDTEPQVTSVLRVLGDGGYGMDATAWEVIANPIKGERLRFLGREGDVVSMQLMSSSGHGVPAAESLTLAPNL